MCRMCVWTIHMWHDNRHQSGTANVIIPCHGIEANVRNFSKHYHMIGAAVVFQASENFLGCFDGLDAWNWSWSWSVHTYYLQLRVVVSLTNTVDVERLSRMTGSWEVQHTGLNGVMSGWSDTDWIEVTNHVSREMTCNVLYLCEWHSHVSLTCAKLNSSCASAESGFVIITALLNFRWGSLVQDRMMHTGTDNHIADSTAQLPGPTQHTWG